MEKTRINVTGEDTSDIKTQSKYTIRVRSIVSDRAEKRGKALKVSVVTFGCQQNEADSERIVGTALDLGYDEANSPEDADLIIYNTCAVREHAELKALSKTGQLKHLKQANPNIIIGLVGCMVSYEARVEDIRKKYPYVDFVAGTNMLHRLPEILCDVMENDRRRFYVDDSVYPVVEGVPVKRKSELSAYVSIMYGCDNFCTYCIVPYVRGRERSRKPSDILREVEGLVNAGVREITLLGQNVNSYGKTLNDEDKCSFAQLLEKIARIDGDFVVRFMTSHPKDVSDELIEVIRDNPKIERHFHLPLQSGNTHLLQQMNRKYTRESYLETVQKLRNNIPDIAITTDIIVGFPSETNEQFEDTLSMLSLVGYDAVFSFIYSPRPGTPAAKLPDEVSYDEKTARHAQLLSLQRDVVLGINESLVGKTLVVLCDTQEDKNGCFTGRTSSFKLVKFKSEDKNIYGKFVNVKIDAYSESLLMGNAVV